MPRKINSSSPTPTAPPPSTAATAATHFSTPMQFSTSLDASDDAYTYFVTFQTIFCLSLAVLFDFFIQPDPKKVSNIVLLALLTCHCEP